MMMWGADRMDHMDSKSMQPGETPGHLAMKPQPGLLQSKPQAGLTSGFPKNASTESAKHDWKKATAKADFHKVVQNTLEPFEMQNFECKGCAK